MHTFSSEQSSVWIVSQLLACSSSKMLCRWRDDEAPATDADGQAGGGFHWCSDESQKDLLFSHGAVWNSSKFGGEGLTSARLIGHLAKYNLKPPPHGHAQAFNCTPSVNTRAHALFLPAAHTLQQAHLQSRPAAAHTLISLLTINTSLGRLFIHARHTWRFGALFVSRSKTVDMLLIGSNGAHSDCTTYSVFTKRSLVRQLVPLSCLSLRFEATAHQCV